MVLKTDYEGALETEQELLVVEPARVPVQVTVSADDAVAREDDRDRVRGARLTGRAWRTGVAGPCRELAVTDRLAVRDPEHLLERPQPEAASERPVERHRELPSRRRRSTPRAGSGAARPPTRPRRRRRRSGAEARHARCSGSSAGSPIRTRPASVVASVSRPIGVSTSAQETVTRLLELGGGGIPEVKRGVGAPGPPGVARALIRRLGAIPSARRRPRSPAGNASGSRSARMATYSTVQSPIPGMRTQPSPRLLERRRRLEPELAGGDGTGKEPDRLCPRGRDPDRLDRGAAARESGSGKRCVIDPRGAGSGSPKRQASRPASVVAPRTETCWPSTARTRARSRPTLPARGVPGRAATSGAERRVGCRATAAIRAGSAPRSKYGAAALRDRHEPRDAAQDRRAERDGRGLVLDLDDHRPRRRSAARAGSTPPSTASTPGSRARPERRAARPRRSGGRYGSRSSTPADARPGARGAAPAAGGRTPSEPPR